MAQQPQQRLFSLFGIVIWGDFGPFTIYRSRYKNIVFFPKTYPKKPPSEAQAAQRERFKNALTRWNQLQKHQKTQWNLAARRAYLCMTGYNLWQYHELTKRTDIIRTIERNTRTHLLDT
jgi:hypothetical protein